MPRFYINSETTEDTFDATENLEDAIRIATDLAKHADDGESVCLEHNGKNIRQFVRLASGEVVEHVLN